MTEAQMRLDMDQKPYRTIWRLTWPQVLMMVFHFLIGYVDVVTAGRLDKNVQASLGVITQAMFFFLVVAMAAANGSVAAISQSMGAGLYKRVQRYVGLLVQIALVSGAVFCLLLFGARQWILGLLQIPEGLFGVADYFLKVYSLTLPAYYLLIISNAVFRARKQVMYPLYCMIIVTTLNTVGDLGLGLGMFGLPKLGYPGLAWATFLSVSGGAAYNLILLRGKGLLALKSFPPWRWVRRAAPYLFKVALPAGIMHIVWHSGYLLLFAITASLPAGAVDALAGMTAGIRIESAMFLPAFAFNFTSSIIVGHYLGERRPDKAKEYGLRILAIAVVGVSLLALAMWNFIEPVAAFTAPAPAVRTEAVSYLFWNFLAIPFTVATMVLGGSFSGAGATLYNLVIFGGCAWLVRLPLAYVLGHHVMGRAEGVWIAMLVSMAVQALAMFAVFMFGNWRGFSMFNSKTPSKD